MVYFRKYKEKNTLSHFLRPVQHGCLEHRSLAEEITGTLTSTKLLIKISQNPI